MTFYSKSWISFSLLEYFGLCKNNILFGANKNFKEGVKNVQKIKIRWFPKELAVLMDFKQSHIEVSKCHALLGPLEISIKVFQKAFEIYLHATKYDTATAFGCDMCPKELKEGESEEDFNETEVQICDWIDLGCEEIESKEFVNKELFHVEKVPGKRLQ